MLNKNKFKIKLNPLIGSEDNYIKISLNTGSFDFVDYGESNTNLLTTSVDNNINPFDDGEKKMFKPNDGEYTLTFNFLNDQYWNRYTYTGFDLTTDILGISPSFTNSFYVFQAYNNFDSKNQILLSTGYFNVYNFAKIFGQNTYDISTHAINSNSESLQVYVPVDFLDTISGDTFSLYFKYFFFNGKTGKFIQFYNKNATSLPVPSNPSVILNVESDLYLKLDFDKLNRRYSFPSNTIYFNEFNNQEYNELINSTVSIIPLEKPTYPTGTSFTINGNYETLNI